MLTFTDTRLAARAVLQSGSGFFSWETKFDQMKMASDGARRVL